MKFRQKDVVYFIILLSVICLGWLIYISFFTYKPEADHWKSMSLPELPAIVNLRVVYAENSRFKSLSDFQIEKILNKTSELAKQHFSVELEFERNPDTAVAHYLSFCHTGQGSISQKKIFKLMMGFLHLTEFATQLNISCNIVIFQQNKLSDMQTPI